MKGELIRVIADDGVELVGFYSAPPSARRAVLHTHGLAGNFYENRFVDSICEAVVSKGLAFFTYNNRGHDYVSDNLKGDGAATEIAPGGSAWEIFDDCVHDIAACSRFLIEHGHDDIYFEGHSLGTSKIVHYLSSRGDTHAVGVILLSPPDMFGLRDERTGGRLDEILAEARELVGAGEGDKLMPNAGYVVPLSAATVVATYGDRNKTDIFPLRLGDEGDYGKLASIRLPMLVIYGTVEEAVTVPTDTAAALIREHAGEGTVVETVTLEGANHVYWGLEADVGRIVGDFVQP
jgi:pimeloyl-ACP methyl ester carboxylesterase